MRPFATLNILLLTFAIFTGISKEIFDLARHGSYRSSNGPTDNPKTYKSESATCDPKKLFKVLRDYRSCHRGPNHFSIW